MGITRAKDKLELRRAIRRGVRGMAEETYPSRVIDDIPEARVVGKTRTGRAPTFRTNNWALPTKPTTVSSPKGAPVATSQYHAGTRIRHATWGEGIVLSSRLQDGDEIVDVVFESVGIKRVAASLATLTII